jgi:hypothetical protein
MMVLTVELIVQRKRIKIKEIIPSMSVGMVTNSKKLGYGMELQLVYRLEKLFLFKDLSLPVHGLIRKSIHNM